MAIALRWRNFTGQHLYFQVKKTKEDLSIKLPVKSLEIIQYFRCLAQKKQCTDTPDPDSFIFPFLKICPNARDKIAVFNAVSSATAYTNKNLRTISTLAAIRKNISFHTARHSWAVRALQKGMRIEYVSKLMGHSSVKHTEIYAKILDEELDKAIQVFDKK